VDSRNRPACRIYIRREDRDHHQGDAQAGKPLERWHEETDGPGYLEDSTEENQYLRVWKAGRDNTCRKGGAEKVQPDAG